MNSLTRDTSLDHWQFDGPVHHYVSTSHSTVACTGPPTGRTSCMSLIVDSTRRKKKKRGRKREITILGINFQILSWHCYGTFAYPSVLACVYNQHLLSGISSSLKNISGNAVPLWPLINLSIVTYYNRKMIENAYSFTSLFFSTVSHRLAVFCFFKSRMEIKLLNLLRRWFSGTL